MYNVCELSHLHNAGKSERYRDVLSQETVIREIRNGIRTRFDPAFAEIMLQMIPEDPEYRMKES